MTLETLKQSKHIILECIAGSKAYGLNTASSDTDIRGIFIQPYQAYYAMNCDEQINNESYDITFYELKKYITLLAKSNPNIIELLNMPHDCILFKHELLNRIDISKVISKQCEKSFMNYAYSQIEKSHSLNKKIFNPMDEARKSVLDFCYVYINKTSHTLMQYLKEKNIQQEHCGLAAIPHVKDCYNLFYSENLKYKGIISSENANEISLSSIEKEESPIAMLFFNKDAYSIYCKDHREYWEWVQKRNTARYENTIAHGKNYDAKNMMHTFRLLYMAYDIATKGEIIVQRPEKEFLLKVKSGAFAYNDLMDKAQKLKQDVETAFQQSPLPTQPDYDYLNNTLVEMRHEWYTMK